MGVQEQLQSLRAKTLSHNTIELCIKSLGSFGAGIRNPSPAFRPNPEPLTTLIVRLNISPRSQCVLRSQVSEKGACIPALNEIATVAEASMTLIRGE